MMLFLFKHRLIADKTVSFKILQLRFACLPTLAAEGSIQIYSVNSKGETTSLRYLSLGDGLVFSSFFPDGQSADDGLAVAVQEGGEAGGVAGMVEEIIHPGLPIYPDL